MHDVYHSQGFNKSHARLGKETTVQYGVSESSGRLCFIIYLFIPAGLALVAAVILPCTELAWILFCTMNLSIKCLPHVHIPLCHPGFLGYNVLPCKPSAWSSTAAAAAEHHTLLHFFKPGPDMWTKCRYNARQLYLEYIV